MISCIKIDERFEVTTVTIAPKFINLECSRVEKIWQQALKENSRLFDGTALCADSVSNELLTCCQVPYRFIYAQTRDLTLKNIQNLKTAAVTGVVIAHDQIFVGKRALDVTQCPGLLELVPAGSLVPSSATNGRVDFTLQLLSELEEEVGISRDKVREIRPFLLIDDEQEGVLDICCKILLDKCESESILDNFRPGEYSKLCALTIEELKASVEKHADRWVPASVLIIAQLAKEHHSPC
ncbi:MAG TPA: hypothetical protein V6C97_32060 [Oculatellaceae cyanobacterium]